MNFAVDCDQLDLFESLDVDILSFDDGFLDVPNNDLDVHLLSESIQDDTPVAEMETQAFVEAPVFVEVTDNDDDYDDTDMDINGSFVDAGVVNNPNDTPMFSPSEEDRVFISDLRDQDILGGRGGEVNNRAANQLLRQWVEESKPFYQGIMNKKDKTALSNGLVDRVIENNGRFVKKADDGHHYSLLTRSQARLKVAQMLREPVRDNLMTGNINSLRLISSLSE